MHAKTQVIARLSVVGVHYWKDAPERQRFLREKHRHTFEIEVVVTVAHGDRDRECFDIADEARRSLGAYLTDDGTYDFGGMSCEMIAHLVLTATVADTVTVLEDGYQGGRVVWTA